MFVLWQNILQEIGLNNKIVVNVLQTGILNSRNTIVLKVFNACTLSSIILLPCFFFRVY